MSGVASVRQGKVFDIEIEGDDRAKAEAALKDAADRLLANTVIENYRVEVVGVIARCVALGAILYAGVFCQTPAFAEDCQTIKRDEAGYLELCNDQLRSFALQMSDQSWRIASGPQGKGGSSVGRRRRWKPGPACMEVLNGASDNPDMLCPGEPVVGFAFDWQSTWQGSKKDGLAIIETLASSPIALYEPRDYPVGNCVPGVRCIHCGSTRPRALPDSWRRQHYRCRVWW